MDYAKCDECRNHHHFSKVRMNCVKDVHGWNCAPARYKYKQRHKDGPNQHVDFLKLLRGDPNFITNLSDNMKHRETVDKEVLDLRKQLNDMQSLISSMSLKKQVKEEKNAY